MIRRSHLAAAVLSAAAIVAIAQTVAPTNTDAGPGDGYSDTPIIPGQKWRVHDKERPRPRVITPGAQYGQPPSDAIVLFDGKDMSKWVELGKRENAGKVLPVSWKVENGYVQCVPRMGDIADEREVRRRPVAHRVVVASEAGR